MDLRRPPRSSSGGVEPKIRQVGFFTPDASAPSEPLPPAAVPAPSTKQGAAAGSPPASDDLSPGRLSPVMIPPPRHADHLAPGPPSPAAADAVLATSAPARSSARLDVASEIADDDSWSRAPSAAELENKRTLAEIRNEGAPAIPQKQKTSKAERRAIQEAQRAAKAAAKEAGKSAGPATSKQAKSAKTAPKKDVPQAASTVASEKKVTERLSERERKLDAPHPRMQFDDVHKVEKAKKRAVVNQSEARNRVELFRHLPQYVHGTQLPDLESKFFQLEPMHPSVYKVGLQYLSGEVSGGNGRCIAMLLAFREAIKDYTTPPNKTLSRDLTAKVSSYVSFLIECRPLSISMGNAIRFLKNRIAKLPHTLSESEAKASLQSDIDRFINEKIVLADKAIVSHAITKVRDNDVLLTYGSSSVVEMILDYAHELGRKFRVIVVDSRPKLEGQGLLRRLVSRGINCTYTHINAISYIMHEVTRVFLGASSILSNGTVYSRVGTASVAMVAHAFGVPVLVCCEAYKFHERVQLDSICANELGDPDVILKVPGKAEDHLKNWAENANLQLLNLTYDATPPDYVSMIVTDYGMLPPTSVPVIVREYRKEQLWI
ncbi:translation initiation factor eIF-2B subunit delta isoform X2 [Setaria italica]|uniref:translation initiation factor eIF-2B subunit delta isoform X2 n=1 Tax=Setaria italica TaxID=4555 RepID=UPI0003508464|nr:translation initiation factor eIF-2B subunit delta isoform X2 [Setaria italica]XP_034575726.1 translation initiation factor eIF-2B subunit delta-like isoform X2 [Setaria viridis]